MRSQNSTQKKQETNNVIEMNAKKKKKNFIILDSLIVYTSTIWVGFNSSGVHVQVVQWGMR